MFFVQHFFHCRFFGKYFFCKPIYSTAGDNLRKLFKTKYKPLKAPVFAPVLRVFQNVIFVHSLLIIF